MIERVPRNLTHPEEVIEGSPSERMKYALEDYLGNELGSMGAFMNPEGSIAKKPELLRKILEEAWSEKNGKLVRFFAERYPLDDFPSGVIASYRETTDELNQLTRSINETYEAIRPHPTAEHLLQASSIILELVERAKKLISH